MGAGRVYEKKVLTLEATSIDSQLASHDSKKFSARLFF